MELGLCSAEDSWVIGCWVVPDLVPDLANEKLKNPLCKFLSSRRYPETLARWQYPVRSLMSQVWVLRCYLRVWRRSPNEIVGKVTVARAVCPLSGWVACWCTSWLNSVNSCNLMKIFLWYQPWALISRTSLLSQGCNTLVLMLPSCPCKTDRCLLCWEEERWQVPRVVFVQGDVRKSQTSVCCAVPACCSSLSIIPAPFLSLFLQVCLRWREESSLDFPGTLTAIAWTLSALGFLKLWFYNFR